MIKKIIFLIQFIFFVTVNSSSEDQEKKDKETKNLYHTLLNNRYFGLPASAIIGGSFAAGLKYFSHNNKFLSSFRAAEKIKHASYFKFVPAGAVGAVGLYELLKRLTKPKKTNDDEKNIKTISSHSSAGLSEKNEKEEPKKDDSQLIRVDYICPGNLYSLINSEDGLKTKTANEIERILGKGEIQRYSKNKFWFYPNDEGLSGPTIFSLRSSDYAAALYLINEDQKESFKDMFNKSSEKESLPYDPYKIKPTSKDNLCCYVLPLESSLDKEGKKTYSCNFSSEITKDNIDAYSFKLSKEDAEKINLYSREIIFLDVKIRTNKQKSIGSSDH